MTKNLFALIALIFTYNTFFSQNNFYDWDTVQKIEITFTQTNWDYQMDTANQGAETYIVAVQCKVNGVIFDSVGVRYKGNSSYNPSNTKNPLHIELNYIKGKQDYQGYTDIKLNNCYRDPSMIRDMLSYEIVRNYMDAPKCNSAEVYINGTYYGLYTNVESVNKSFIGDNYYSTDNARFKCNPRQVGFYASDLRYLGSNPTSYYNHYELQSDTTLDWYQLINLCDTLNNNFSSIENILDIDRAIWMLAFNNVLVNLDSYSGNFRQNYYLYRDDNNRFCPTPWDLNMAFGGFRTLNTFTTLDTNTMKTLSPSANSTSSNHPLIQRIWSNPTYQRMYIAHMKTITQEMFASGIYYTRAQQMQSVINTSVQADIYKFYSNAQFASSLTANTPNGPNWIPGITNLMNARVTYLNGTSYFTNTAPVISSITISNPTPAVFTTVYITAAITNPTYAYVGYRSTCPSKFIKVQMMDDGMNGDGAAGDSIYGAAIPLNSAVTEYYIYAENSNAGLFAPERAEHEFYTITAAAPPHLAGEVVINEILPDNDLGTPDANGQYEDWVELHNNTANPISLKGIYLSDTLPNLGKWNFPDWATIPANGYLIVWCDEDNGQSGYHSNFKFWNPGESVYLYDSIAGMLDSITFGYSYADLTFARCPNGTGGFSGNTVATFNAYNTCVASVADNQAAGWINVYPNPNNGLFTVEALGELEIYNVLGEKIIAQRLETTKTEVDLRSYAKGIYFVKIAYESKTYSKKIIIQ